MERYAWKATVKNGMLEEYIRRHDDLWPEMKQMLHAAGIRTELRNSLGEVAGCHKGRIVGVDEALVCLACHSHVGELVVGGLFTLTRPLTL